MKPSADLSLPGMARLVGEFLDRLGLADVTLVGNDSGAAITQMLISGGAPWVGRVVLAPCEAFGNFPPGLTGRTRSGGHAARTRHPRPSRRLQESRTGGWGRGRSPGGGP
jgi:pimeloyl-ACP methyl ester carboxylesterase